MEKAGINQTCIGNEFYQLATPPSGNADKSQVMRQATAVNISKLKKLCKEVLLK